MSLELTPPPSPYLLAGTGKGHTSLSYLLVFFLFGRHGGLPFFASWGLGIGDQLLRQNFYFLFIAVLRFSYNVNVLEVKLKHVLLYKDSIQYC